MNRARALLIPCLIAVSLLGGCPLPLQLVSEKQGETVAISLQPPAVRALLDIPLRQVSPEMVRRVTDSSLWESLRSAAQQAGEGEFSFEVFLGLVPGLSDDSELTIWFEPSMPEVQTLLASDGVEPDPNGVYSVVDLMFINNQQTCNIYRYPNVSAEVISEHKGSKPTGGCCAILATAHSLVRKMGGIVRKSDATIDKNGDGKPDEWDPDFLKKIRRASGDTDSDRGLTDSQAEKAHKADWNTAWKVQQIDDDVELYDGVNLSCDEIKKRCNKLIQRLRTNDDISMRIRGKDGKTAAEWGHRVVVEKASFSDGPPCCCAITITQTSVTEPSGRTDYVGIPFDPGTATYRICTDPDGKTTVTNTEFPGSIITHLAFDSFDEEPKRPDVRSQDQGNPGSALRD